MTVKNAINLAQKAIKGNKIYLEKIHKYDKEYPDTSEQQLASRMSNLVISIVEDENRILCEIIKQIKPNCKHPKKMIDTINGQKYCMNCNLDL